MQTVLSKAKGRLRRLLPLLLALGLVTGGAVVTQVVASAPAFASTVGTNDYPYGSYDGPGSNPSTYTWYDPSGTSYLSPLRFAYRNCTDYAAYEINEQMGGSTSNIKFSWSNIEVGSDGNARAWKQGAINMGKAVDPNPAVGSIAWWGTEVGGGYGHVAIVSAVSTDGNTITISDYNSGQGGWGNYASYSLTKGSSSNYMAWPDDFLHVADVSNSGGGSGGGTHSSAIIKVKKTVASDGTQQVYYATTSDVYEAWWNSTSNGVQRDNLINIAQNNIVDIDKVSQPDGTQSLYTAVPDGIWESYWNPVSNGVHSGKIITGLSGVSKVIATSEIDSGVYTHVLYVLTSSGPYQFWWQDGGNGIHSVQLAQINNAVAIAADQTSSGTDQVYTATAGEVYETWWNPGGTITTSPIITISQNDITDVSKVIASDGTNELYTSTPYGVWQSEWGGSVGNLTNTYVVNNFSGSVGVLKMFDPSGTDNLYVANGSQVQQYWWNTSGSGGTTLITISQNNITSIDADYYNGVGQLYTAAGAWVWETWWDSSGVHTAQLANANP